MTYLRPGKNTFFFYSFFFYSFFFFQHPPLPPPCVTLKLKVSMFINNGQRCYRFLLFTQFLYGMDLKWLWYQRQKLQIITTQDSSSIKIQQNWQNYGCLPQYCTSWSQYLLVGMSFDLSWENEDALESGVTQNCSCVLFLTGALIQLQI